MGKRSVWVEWQQTEERAVAFIDIMGYKSLLASKSHEQIYGLMRGVAEIVNDAHTNRRVISGDVFDMKEQLCKAVLFSDSILLVSADLDKDAFFSILMASMKIYFHLLRHGVACRGGM